MSEPADLWTLKIRLSLRRARRSADMTQDELAATMRALGFDWVRSTVAKVESGQRGVQAVEVVGWMMAVGR